MNYLTLLHSAGFRSKNTPPPPPQTNKNVSNTTSHKRVLKTVIEIRMISLYPSAQTCRRSYSKFHPLSPLEMHLGRWGW